MATAPLSFSVDRRLLLLCLCVSLGIGVGMALDARLNGINSGPGDRSGSGFLVFAAVRLCIVLWHLSVHGRRTSPLSADQFEPSAFSGNFFEWVAMGLHATPRPAAWMGIRGDAGTGGISHSFGADWL